MINVLRDKVDSLLGRGKYSAFVPVMDGPLQPNQGLDSAEVLLSQQQLDNLTSVGDNLYFSSGSSLIRCDAGGSREQVATFDSEITCIASDGRGAMAIGLDGAGIAIRGGVHDGRLIKTVGGVSLVCPTDALFFGPDRLVVVSGSATYSASQWKRDLMNLGRSGSVWEVALDSGGERCLAGGLGYPYGVADAGNAELLVSEAWRHRLLRIGRGGAASVMTVLEDLPGYPSRLAPAARGGFWLTLFAPRNQLLEFILGERRYCDQMIRTIDPAYWIAPSLASGVSFKETLQYGAVKRMGVLKPWAPTWSYGLVVLLGADLNPVASWHSRADGVRHGVTSVTEHRARTIVGAKGAGLALVLNESDLAEKLL
ncbi:strictosidine synthase [Caballeronia sp. GAWG1-1]|uniref:strictosidine synthase n=1 Tax=Caballeronia sp. GAWG1-1 TaxID=2921742 RepID=UPI0020287916|nr:strictosidine synthase [Caballeronia sp. GAWG1-1]